jgi:hypothetical protein
MDRREAFLRAREQRFNVLGENLELGAFGSEVVRHMLAQTRFELAWIRRLRRLNLVQTETSQSRSVQ